MRISKVIGLLVKKSYTTYFMAQDAVFMAQDFHAMLYVRKS
jgi:hypothetical protein